MAKLTTAETARIVLDVLWFITPPLVGVAILAVIAWWFYRQGFSAAKPQIATHEATSDELKFSREPTARGDGGVAENEDKK